MLSALASFQLSDRFGEGRRIRASGAPSREIAMLPMTLKIEPDGTVKVFLRDVEATAEIEDEVILDVDHAGH